MLFRFRPAAYADFVPEAPLVSENPFVNRAPDERRPPLLADVRDRIPEPFWDGHDAEMACYWRVWDLAFRNLKRAAPHNGFIRPFIDTAYNDCLFLWDSVFILMFARYGERAFRFQETLDNLYHFQEADGFLPREVQEWDGQHRFHRHDPVSTGPNVFAWSEWEYFLNFGDSERLRDVFPGLLAYHRWMRRYRTWQDGTYWSCGLACGMDNQPRASEAFEAFTDHGHLSWIDATAQAALNARLLRQIAGVIGREGEVADLADEERNLGETINRDFWNEERGFYFDRDRHGRPTEVPTIGAYWVLLAGLVPAERLNRFVSHLEAADEFATHHRVPSMPASHPDYHPLGSYWLGGVWPPTNYMILRGLTLAGRDGLAFEIAANHVRRVTEVFEKTGTVWENYAPDVSEPGNNSKGDFVGWGGVGPVAVLFEYLFGLRPDVPSGELLLDVRLTERYGIRRYPFGAATTLDLAVAARASEFDEPQVDVVSDHPVRLRIRWAGGERVRDVG
ncbi:MAG: trehalase family glycosidase [Terrimicrobiaceae bacterium]|nr:trehalase family glycosidase [Terrimicrobiaceae bacterium]